jgi:serine/threonine protein kinase
MCLPVLVSQDGIEPSLNVVASLAKGIAQVMAKVHEMGVAHRDLTAGNIMRLNDGSIKIIDFGLAATIDDKQEMMRIVGTPE